MLPRSLKFNFHISSRNQFRTKYEWIKPEGYDTGIKVYNEIAKRKVPLIFPNPNYVKWYMCGPTVYDTSHIGHASCYIKSDIIRRILKIYYNIDPVVAIGVTDISEKIVNKARSLNLPYRAVTKKYEMEFFSQMKELNVLPPSLILRVSNHFPILKGYVSKLVEKGVAYKAVSGDIYFKTNASPNYGKFKEPVPEPDQLNIPGKWNNLDFALWKVGNENGVGVPGWHIQCSAMASFVFGKSLDLHSGGKDLIFPHHENEEAQSTAYFGCEQWVNYWIHTGLVNMEDEKMSKSLNNFISIKEFLRKNTGDHLRMFCMMSPYGNSLKYDPRAVELGASICEKVLRFLSVSDSYVKGTWLIGKVNEEELFKEVEKTKDLVKEHLSNDFGVHEALKCILLLIKKVTKMLYDDSVKNAARSPAAVANVHLYVNDFFTSFGFSFPETAIKSDTPTPLEAIVDAAVNLRMRIREKALFLNFSSKKEIMSLCDEFRDNLQLSGITINDLSPSHTHWSLKTNKTSNGSELKNVIDILVWFRSKVMNVLSSVGNEADKIMLMDICRSTKLNLAALGVIIHDSDGRSFWSFPKVDSEGTSRFNTIIDSTLSFYADIRRIALSLADENVKPGQVKEEILSLCDSAVSNLRSFGVNINSSDLSERNWFLEVNNSRGVSIIQNVMDMIMNSREQVKSLALTAKREETKMKLDNICYKTKKYLLGYGFSISDSFDPSHNSSIWSINERLNKKSIIKNVIDVLVIFMNDLKEVTAALDDDEEMSKVILEIHDTLERDLDKLGVVIVAGNHRPTWSFKECESNAEWNQQM